MQSLKINGTEHQIDSIVGFKRGVDGKPLFQVAMMCPCCEGRLCWLTQERIHQDASGELDDLAN